MQRKLFSRAFAPLLAAAAIMLLAAPAHAGSLRGLVGNDTGGIIPWNPVTERYRFAIAGEHCARYGKFARITSVHRQYGDYIGFACRFGRGGKVVVTLY
jgi:hypothetical protein